MRLRWWKDERTILETWDARDRVGSMTTPMSRTEEETASGELARVRLVRDGSDLR
jgi:hypothetical protein